MVLSTRSKSPRRRSKSRRRPTARPRPLLNTLTLIVRLGRPRFLVYSALCHLIGVLAARVAGAQIDWRSAACLQASVWCTHLFAHFVNEYADVEADRANVNASGWTGGSGVLSLGLLPPIYAVVMAVVTGLGALLSGVLCVLRYLSVRHAVTVRSYAQLSAALPLVPWQFVAVGVSVLAVAAAYSLPPLRLSANALGEWCVAYVLSFAAPCVGLLSQGGALSWPFVQLLLPFLLLSFARMVVMNTADRDGDLKTGKVTSVVWLGERRAMLFVTAVHVFVYAMLIPSLPLSTPVRLAYYSLLPFRWLQSLKLNALEPWWLNDKLVRQVPFLESLAVLLTAAALAIALAFFEKIQT